MPLFQYHAVDGNGVSVEGEVEVPNKKELEVYLNARGLYLNSYRRNRANNILFAKKVKLRDIIIFSRQFSIMIHAGISLKEALYTISSFTVNKTLAGTLREIENDLSVGVPMSESMKKHQNIFKFFFISMMQIGEFSGELDTVLVKTADYYEDEGRLMKKIRSALIYPSVLVVLIIILIWFIMVRLVPTYEQMFSSMRIELPAITQILISTSHFFQTYGIILIGILSLACFLLYRYYKTDSGRYKIDNLIIHVPMINVVYQKSTTARFARSMNILLNSGITIVQSFDILDSLIQNKVIQERLHICKDGVNLGYSYHVSLQKMEFFPDILINMVAVGEKTGSLGEIFDKTSTFFQEEADAAIDRLVFLIEPIMMVIMAIIILITFLAVMLPMFDILNNVSTVG